MPLTRINAENIQQTTLDNLGSGPLIANVQIADSNYDALDDTAIALEGGYIILNGSKFEQNVNVLIDGTQATSITYISENQIAAQVGAKTAGSYIVYVVNTDTGATAIRINGLTYSDFPTWSTDSALSGSEALINVNIQLIATDATSYSLAAGNTLPSDLSLNSAGYITGTVASNTTTNYNFTVLATDDENQDSPRSFTLPITQNDPPSWVTASDLGSVVNASAFNSTVEATDNQSVSYSLEAGSTLPTGLTLNSNGNISGTISVAEANTYSFNVVATDTANLYSSRTFSVTVTFGDEYFNQTTLLLNADDNTFITDASDNAFTITPNGDTRPSAFSPYNTNWSNYFDGTGDYLTVPNDADFDLTGEFTIEGWLYFTTNNNAVLFDTRLTASDGFVISPRSDGTIELDRDGSNILNGTIVRPLNAWSHFVIVRNASNNLSMFINGVRDVTTTNSDSFNSSTTVHIGAKALAVSGLVPITGYVSGLRIVKGTAVYDPTQTTLTVPTAPLEPIAGTSLLTCQSNRFIDNSTNNFTITRNGDVKVTSFGPFTETDTTTGSGYFDGTGDYLLVSNNASIDLGSSDFTIEGWVYITAYSAGAATFIDRGVYASAVSYRSLITSTQFSIELSDDGSAPYSVLTCSTAMPLNTWIHLALVRNGNTVAGFKDGIQINSMSFTSSVHNTGQNLAIGGALDGNNSYNLIGHISNFRFVKGTAIVPPAGGPTAPLTAVSGTSLLTLQNRIGYNNSQPIDESGIRNIITRNGNASAGTFSPHVPTGWSAYFDGTGDYLSYGSNALFTFGTGDFTVEAWVYLSAATDFNIFNVGGTSTGSYSLYWISSIQKFESIRYGDTAGSGRTTNTYSINTWYHVAAVRSGGVAKLYINGVEDTGSTYAMGSITASAAETGRIWAVSAVNTGYLTNLRIVKGTAVYTTDFDDNLPTAPLEPITGTSLLTLRGPGFTDDGPNRFAITRNGDTKITPFSPFAPHTRTPDSHSVYFDGTGDYLDAGSNAAFQMGTGDFTYECWVYHTSVSGQQTYFSDQFGNQAGVYFYKNTSNFPGVYYSSQIATSSIAVTAGQWYHLVASRASGTLKIFVNGVQGASVSDTTNLTQQTQFIGGDTGSSMLGYISNARIVKGTAVYTTDFDDNLPTAPLTAISGTSLLTCQSPTITDNSDNEFAITVNGNSQPTKFNPFGETVTTGVEYAPVSHGGSMYFPGAATDGLIAPQTADFNLSLGNWTIEAWYYTPTNQASNRYITALASNNSEIGVIIQINFFNLNYFGASGPIVTSVSPILHSWQHVALVKNGVVTTLYIDGVAAGSASNVTWFNGSTRIYFGSNTGSPSYQFDYEGYVSGARVVREALYTSNFSVPTTPPSPTPNSLLVYNFAKSAAIQNRTGRTVLQSVGNVRVVNGVKKFGSGAMYFDGTTSNLTSPYTDLYSFGTGDFTVEGWFYFLNRESTLRSLVMLGDGANGSGPVTNSWGLTYWGTEGSYQIVFTRYDGGTSLLYATVGATILNNQWYHIAVSRSSGTLKIFVDGVAYYNNTVTQTFAAINTMPLRIGLGYYGPQATYGGPRYWNGYIDDLRITKGVARYTVDFSNNLPSTTFPLK